MLTERRLYIQDICPSPTFAQGSLRFWKPLLCLVFWKNEDPSELYKMLTRPLNGVVYIQQYGIWHFYHDDALSWKMWNHNRTLLLSRNIHAQDNTCMICFPITVVILQQLSVAISMLGFFAVIWLLAYSIN